MRQDNEDMKYIYWSHIKMMRECPQRYLWSKGHPDHDLGAGIGKKKPLPPENQRESEHHLLMGSVLSKVVEDFYNHELWSEPKTLQDKLEDLARKEFVFQEQRYYCLWNYMTRDEAIDVVVSGASNFLKIMKENRLLGVWNKSELKMTPSVNKYFSASGIADLVYRDKEDRIHILDGKNASTPGKYEDQDQLRWYALCFRLQYNVMPHRLGFFYFRYPSDILPNMKHVPEKYQGDKWTGFMEVDFTMADIKRLAAEGVETSKAIHRGVFEANPMPKHCRTCPYESVCEERQEQKARNAAKRGLRKTKTPDPTEGNDGFVDLSFGSKT
tara:strand:- start:364 stop:1344 length:981 start_codon:yes stop_codon:yes gene_type:complete